MRIYIPNTRTSPFSLHSSLDLVSGRGNAPPEAGGEFPAFILGGQGILGAGREGGVIKGWRRNELGGGNGGGGDGGVDCCGLDGADEEVPVFCNSVKMMVNGVERDARYVGRRC